MRLLIIGAAEVPSASHVLLSLQDRGVPFKPRITKGIPLPEVITCPQEFWDIRNVEGILRNTIPSLTIQKTKTHPQLM